MSKETIKDAPYKIGFVGINKVLLRNSAMALEEQLKADAKTSKDIADFAEYPPLASAIQRAKAMQVDLPEEIPGMRYWLFETELAAPRYRKLGELRADFALQFKGWKVDESP
jgi:hypothetical protein